MMEDLSNPFLQSKHPWQQGSDDSQVAEQFCLGPKKKNPFIQINYVH